MLTRIPTASVDQDDSDENDDGENGDSDHGNSASVKAEYCALWRGSPTAEILLMPVRPEVVLDTVTIPLLSAI